MFSSNYVKISKVDWKVRELEYNEMLQKIAELESKNAELEKNQSPFLINIVSRQSDEIKKLLKYKEQDDTLFSYEQSNDKHLETIKTQKAKIEDLEKTNQTILNAYNLESDISSDLAKKIIDGRYNCETYKTVSTFETHA